jgi:hypothetical protein
MGKKRPERTARRAAARDARRLVRDRERLAALSPGGSDERPITISSPAVIDSRIASMRCPQCEGSYALDDHRADPRGLREVHVTCRLCHTPRAIWFRLGSSAPS